MRTQLRPLAFLVLLPTLALACADGPDEGATSVQELTENNVDPGFFAVHEVIGSEDTPIPLSSALTVGPRLLDGGALPDVAATRTAFLADGADGPMAFDLSAVSASVARVTIVGTER